MLSGIRISASGEIKSYSMDDVHKQSKTDKPDVKALADMQDYHTFIEAFDILLSTIRGARTAPLTYICRNEEAPADNVDASLDYDEML
jgi:hypothetical protein